MATKIYNKKLAKRVAEFEVDIYKIRSRIGDITPSAAEAERLMQKQVNADIATLAAAGFDKHGYKIGASAVKEKSQELRAVWEHDQKVLLYRGDVLIANVCVGNAGFGWPIGWLVFPINSDRTASRKTYVSPSLAIKAMYGVNLRIQVKGGK